MKKDIKYAAAVESEAQTLETYKAASAAHDVQFYLLLLWQWDLSPEYLQHHNITFLQW